MDTVEKIVGAIMEGKLVKLEVICTNDDEVRNLKDAIRKLTPQLVLDAGGINEIVLPNNTINVVVKLKVDVPLPWVRSSLLSALRSKSSTVTFI